MTRRMKRTMPSPTARLQEIRQRLARAAEARAAEQEGSREARILAASKYAAAQQIRSLLLAGHRLFGENRVQDALAKWRPLKEEFPDAELHMIGHLQRNKLTPACRLFDAIETVESLALAEGLARHRDRFGAIPPFFVQINTGEEERKYGVPPPQADEFLDRLRKMDLHPKGLMCIPPLKEDPSPHFALLRQMAKRHGIQEISCGMSADYEIAAMLGATIVRIGQGLFSAS